MSFPTLSPELLKLLECHELNSKWSSDSACFEVTDDDGRYFFSITGDIAEFNLNSLLKFAANKATRNYHEGLEQGKNNLAYTLRKLLGLPS